MFREYDLRTFKDDKGGLTPVELSEYCDFIPKRIYTVYDSVNKTRGGHAHIVEEELFFMASGTCVGKFHDGKDWFEIKLEANKNLVYVPIMLWHQFEQFSDDAVLVAVSSTNYNPDRSDYIEDFDNFLNNV
jgi:dTDP-4-dehydrorhamnose 3,5-epimerase-like enzyme